MTRTTDVLDHPVTRAVTGTALVGGVVIAVAVSLSALIVPLPVADIGEPVVVDEAPGLPSDEEPAEGWPAPTITDDSTGDTQGTGDEDAATGSSTTEQPATTDEDDAADDTGLLDDVTDTVDDLVDDVTDTVDDVVDDVTDTVDDVVDDVTDTVDDVVEDPLP